MITLRKLDRTNSNLTKPYNLGITRIIKFRTRNKLDSPLYFAHRLVPTTREFSAKLGFGSSTPSSDVTNQRRAPVDLISKPFSKPAVKLGKKVYKSKLADTLCDIKLIVVRNKAVLDPKLFSLYGSVETEDNGRICINRRRGKLLDVSITPVSKHSSYYGLVVIGDEAGRASEGWVSYGHKGLYLYCVQNGPLSDNIMDDNRAKLVRTRSPHVAMQVGKIGKPTKNNLSYVAYTCNNDNNDRLDKQIYNENKKYNKNVWWLHWTNKKTYNIVFPTKSSDLHFYGVNVTILSPVSLETPLRPTGYLNRQDIKDYNDGTWTLKNE